MPRCRYCGMPIGSPDAPLQQERTRRQGVEDYALLVAIGAMALPGQAALAPLTPPWQVPSEALALVPMAALAAALGFLLGALWLPRRTWMMAPAIVLIFQTLSAGFVLSWRRMMLPLDPEILGASVVVGLVGLAACFLGRGAGWLWRRGVEERG